MEIADLRNEIKLDAAESSLFEFESFIRIFARHLEESEQLVNSAIEILNCKGPRGKRVELAGFSEDELEGSLTLIAGRYFGADETLTLTEAKEVLKRAVSFIEHAADGWLLENLEISSREYEYAQYFKEQIVKKRYSSIRILLLTDGVMSDRIRTIESETAASLPVTYEIWDQKRLLDALIPELGSEDIHVDFTRWMPKGLPCLPAGAPESGTKTILAVIPAVVLCSIFEEFGSLLLESNVRTFLSARGAVNKGIQNTLLHEPEKFLAYNNGLTTTATSVELKSSEGQSYLQRIDRWQIVNGGQTTASLAHFTRIDKSRSLADVFVQMKLVLVEAEDSSQMVQAVAKYANSQNRVSAADLFATHEFHIRLEQISRRVRANAKQGEQYLTGWFYERARGQWENERNAKKSMSDQKKFEREFPRTQKIVKTDWAKYFFSWGQKPHIVSRGSQFVFSEFAQEIDKYWAKNDSEFNEGYFQNGVALAIIHEQLTTKVSQADWYKASPGYRANIVTYAIAALSAAIAESGTGLRLNLRKIWERQGASDQVLQALLTYARMAQAHLTDTSRPQANVTQWAKQQACWDSFSNRGFTLPSNINSDLISSAESRAEADANAKIQKIDSGLEAMTRILGVSITVWDLVKTANSVVISPKERDLLRLFGGTGSPPSELQAKALLRLLEKCTREGVLPPGSY